MRRALLALLVLVPAAFAAPAGAVGTGSGQVTGVDGVLYDDCVRQSYRYAVDLPADVQSWSLAVAVRGPDGQVADTGQLSTGEPMSGTSTFTLCPPADLYGAYTIEATLAWVDVDSNPNMSVLDASQFTMRKPYTRTSLSVSTRRPAYRQLVAYRIRVWDERPEGYVATPFAWVHLEKRVDGRWVQMLGTRTLTHSTGQVKVRLRYRHHHQRLRVRSVAEEAPRFQRSVSPGVRLW